jgi:hypothetical protein
MNEISTLNTLRQCFIDIIPDYDGRTHRCSGFFVNYFKNLFFSLDNLTMKVVFANMTFRQTKTTQIM